MTDIIKSLLLLQEQDLLCKRISRDLETLPKRVKHITASVTGAQKKLDDLHVELKNLRKDLKLKEVDVESKKQDIVKFKKQQYETKKNVEYQALLTEIKRAEDSISATEDEEIALLEKEESLQADIERTEADLAKRKKVASFELQDLKKYRTNSNEQMLQARKKRKELAKGVSAEILETYQNLTNAKGDAVVCEIKNNTCSGCHMTLSNSMLNDVRTTKALSFCPNCTRVIYLIE